MFARMHLYATTIVVASLLGSTASAKPPELPGQPIEFKVLPSQTQEFFQLEDRSGGPSEESPSVVPEKKSRSEAEAISSRCALMLLAGGMAHDEEPAETTEKWWSIKQLFEMVMPHDAMRDHHDAGRCTRP